MRYRGRNIDPIALWSRYVEFPSSFRTSDVFSPKVVCPNPSHDTLKSHFQINLQQPMVHCFAYCGISGSIEHAICVIEGFYEKFDVDLTVVKTAWSKKPKERSANEREQLRREFRAKRQARKIIIGSASGKARKSEKPHVQKKRSGNSGAAKVIPTGEFDYDSFLPPVALEYLTERGITGESIARWELGWLPEEKRIAIPARDENGHLRFLIKRAVLPKQNPKYLYTEGFPKTSLLFGACQIDLGMISSHGLIVVEGSVGTILNHQDGLKNTVAILGTGISEEQRRIIARIRPPKIFLMFDKDSAGIRNIEIAASMLRKYPLFVVRFPKGKSDWDSVTKEEKFRQIDRSIPLFRFIHENSLNVIPKRRSRVA
jgi:DNA primase